MLTGGLLEAVPVGDIGEDYYLEVPVEKFPHLKMFLAPVCSLAD